MNPTPHIVESALLLIAAFFIGCCIGYLAKRFFGRRTEQAASGKRPTMASSSTAKPDNLKSIKGIGPKMEAMLYDNGITRFEQIAAWDARTIADMNVKLGTRGRIEREKWVSQAQMLARSVQA